VAFIGKLRVETAGPIYGWACDFCGQKAESSTKEQPKCWYDSGGSRIEFGGYNTYTISSLYCTQRCHAMWNKKPWPPEENDADDF
jgi:hypothetical protein